MERQAEEGRKEVEEEEKNHREKATYREGVVEAEGDAAAGGGGKEEEEEEEEEGEGKKEEEKGEEEEVREEYRLKPEPVTGGQSESREQRAKSVTSNTEEGEGEDEEADEDNKDADDNDEYMEMKGMQPAALQPKVTEHSNDSAFDASDILNSTKVEEDDLRLSGYVQDNFDFLDQMDCSVHDHMDCSVSYQVNEFSVEPPGHSDDEYEVMEQALSARHPPEVKIHPQSSGPETHTMSPTELNPHRPLSIDMHSRHTKSLSLPYMTSPVHGPEESCSEEDAAEDDSDDDVYSSSEDDDSMFVKSLPPDFFLNSLSGFDLDTDTQHGCTLDGVQSSEEREVQSTNPELPACKESTAGDQDQLENNRKSKVTEEDRGAMGDTESDKEQPLTSESSTNHCTEFPMPSDDESQAVANVTVEREKGEVVDETHVEESRDSEHVGGDSDEGEDRKACNETEDRCKEVALEIKESDGNTWEATADKEHEEKMQEGVGEQEMIEDEESEKAEKKGGRGSVAVDGDMIKDGEEEEQIAKFSGEGVLEADGGGTDETEEKLTDSGTEKETNSPKTCDEESQGKLAVSDRAQLHDREEVVSKEKENNDRADERRRTPRRADKQPKEVREPKEDRKHEESDAGQGGVGRKLVISKNPKVYQVKAVPVVPPKPQHCKITALTLRQQQQQRERRDADRGRESTARDGDDGDDEGRGHAAKRERPALWGGEGSWRGGGTGTTAPPGTPNNRNSPLSMCFDEAVAIATMRREKEKECEKEKERHRDWGNENTASIPEIVGRHVMVSFNTLKP
ncbi:hypothetical protein L3Q82_006097 [Scortum barcoo]|uniref:Uncharacterized protein n=1 Tax=Scortum barcoo TaxID=214431 RepID=A0ACB8X2C1_9TELE|nr:hypothetical protein L3Q82_006097 [Scortum barcoo]